MPGNGIPAGASDPTSLTFQSSSNMAGGFDVTFSIPFSRVDVYKELLVPDSPLGSSPNVTFRILRPGYDEADPMSPGCVRRVEFGAPFNGETVSELTVAERGPNESGSSSIKWRQLESSTKLNLLGNPAEGDYPEFTVTLEGGPQGTLVKLIYNFARVRRRGEGAAAPAAGRRRPAVAAQPPPSRLRFAAPHADGDVGPALLHEQRDAAAAQVAPRLVDHERVALRDGPPRLRAGEEAVRRRPRPRTAARARRAPGRAPR